MTGLEQAKRILKKYEKTSQKCYLCHNRITELTGRQQTSMGTMCDDCYYSEWGKIVEEYPIGGH